MHEILQTHLLRALVANLKIGVIYALYPESFCDPNLAIRKVFAFSDSGHASWQRALFHFVCLQLFRPLQPPAGGMSAGGMSEWRLVRLKACPHGGLPAGEMSANQITESLNSIGQRCHLNWSRPPEMDPMRTHWLSSRLLLYYRKSAIGLN